MTVRRFLFAVNALHSLSFFFSQPRLGNKKKYFRLRQSQYFSFLLDKRSTKMKNALDHHLFVLSKLDRSIDEDRCANDQWTRTSATRGENIYLNDVERRRKARCVLFFLCSVFHSVSCSTPSSLTAYRLFFFLTIKKN